MSLKPFKNGIGRKSVLLGIVFLCGTFSVYSQDYTIDIYNEYQRAVEEGEGPLIAFIKKYPKISLVEHAVAAYVQRVKGYVEKPDHQAAVASGEKFMNEVDAKNFEIQYLTTWSAFYSQQYDKAALYGEKVYAAKPDTPQIVPILARSYLNTGNTEKAIEFGEKYCATVEPKDCYDLLPTITKYYAQNKDWNSAQKYAEKTVEAFESVQKPAQVSQADWDSFANEEKSICHAIMGRHAFETKRWRSVETHYSTATKLNPKNRARRAEGHYYTGMARWSRDQIDPAMESFARGSKLSGTAHADPCRKQLEKLYKATHNGSLAGLDEFLEDVGSD